MVADSQTALRLSRVADLSIWRAPATWLFVAAIPLILMSRHIVDIVRNAVRYGGSPLELVGVYFGLLAATVVIVALMTAVRMLWPNKRVKAYAAAGMPIWVRYHRDSLEVPPATGHTRIAYDRIAEVVVGKTAVFVRPREGDGFALPRELVPEFAVQFLRSNRASPARIPRRGLRASLVAAGSVIVAVAVVAGIGFFAQSSKGYQTIAIDSPNPFGAVIAVDSAAHTLYVANKVNSYDNSQRSSLSIIDLATNSVIGNLPLPYVPRGIAVDSGTQTVYVVSGKDKGDDTGTVTVIDRASGTVTATIRTGLDSWQVAVDESTHTAYILNLDNDGYSTPQTHVYSTLSVLSRGASAVSPPKTIGKSGDIDHIFIDSSTHRAYATGTARLDTIDLSTLATIASTDAPLSIESVFFDQPTRTAVLVGGSGDVAVGDIGRESRLRLLDHYLLENTCKDRMLQEENIDAAAHRLYVACRQEGRITVFDTDSGAVTDTLSLHEPDAMAVDPATHTLYVFTLRQGGADIAVVPRG
ncbi:YncE family protein [Nocardia sp. JMUB6875]|uniref:YncE family protein n=1 Tax=Nocardia sp. JMUB6875 TaxID=3158170 RepID=UPI0034E8F7A0